MTCGGPGVSIILIVLSNLPKANHFASGCGLLELLNPSFRKLSSVDNKALEL